MLFLEDPSPGAYEKVVHQLLESEQHAVRYVQGIGWMSRDTPMRMRA